MKLETIHIDNTVRSGLNSFTDGVIFRDTKVLITLNLPDGQKTALLQIVGGDKLIIPFC